MKNQTSRERVRRCLAFKNPDHPPMTLPAPYPNDILGAGISEDPDWKPWKTWEFADFRQWEDEWHNVWKCLPTTSGGEVIKGALKDWPTLSSYQMPRLDLLSRYEQAALQFIDYPDMYHLGTLAGFPFSIMRYMRTVEQFLADVLLYQDEVMTLQQMVIDLLKRCIDRWAQIHADGVMFYEDWGTQERLLVSPNLWHEMFEPGFRELVGHARERGLDVWMHSCGYIKDIIPSLVDMGINVLQLDQPKLSGLDFLREQCHGKCAIWSPVDIQKDLPSGDEQYIRACARELIDTLGKSGGFICGHYGAPLSLGVQPESQLWAADEFVRHSGVQI